jgi:hypothetical protein
LRYIAKCTTIAAVLRTCCFVVTLAASAIAHAQPISSPPNIQEAERLFEEGRTLGKEKRWAEACERFERSYRIDPSIGTTLNLADCHEHLGHAREAWRLFDEAATKSESTAETKRTLFARERAAAAAAKLGTVIVRVPQPVPLGLVITIAGRPVAIGADAQDHVDPGDVEIAATLPGKPRFATIIKVVAGATLSVDLPSSPTPLEQPPVARRDSSRRTRVMVAWTLGGVGVGSAIVATALTLTARDKYQGVASGPDCMQLTSGITCNAAGSRAIEDAQARADLGTVFAIGSVALLVTGAVLYVTAPVENRVKVAPLASPHGGGVAVHGRF